MGSIHQIIHMQGEIAQIRDTEQIQIRMKQNSENHTCIYSKMQYEFSTIFTPILLDYLYVNNHGSNVVKGPNTSEINENEKLFKLITCLENLF